MEEAKGETKASSDSEASSSEIISKWTDPTLFDSVGLEDDLCIESGRTCPSNGVKEQASRGNKKYNVLICTDFTFPKFGGVETHGYQVAQCLIERGHNVCFITSKVSSERFGVRYMANGLKIYHVPQIKVVVGESSFLTFFNSLPVLRQILIREKIDIVHGHASTSILQNTMLMAAKALGVKTCFTEHSLFTFNEAFGLNLNKIIKWTMRDLDAAICVSNACKDNFVLRAGYDPGKTFTIPNAVDSVRFTPDFEIRNKEIKKSGNPERINIVFVSRLQYRKGVDLLIPIIPKILEANENVHFIIGGDGEGMGKLQQLIENHNLHDRVELLGGLPHDKVRDVLCRGHIFLNTSLTESFCIAILEAACCGLLVVSTDVGGVPEVLPPHMVYLAKPEPSCIINELTNAINDIKTINTENFNEELSQIYNWRTIAEKTEKVYDYAIECPQSSVCDRLRSAFAIGQVSGFFAVIYLVLEFITLAVTEYFMPDWEIDTALNFNTTEYRKNMTEFGDHEVYVNSSDPRFIKKTTEIQITPEFVKTVNHPSRFIKTRRYSTQIPKVTQAVESPIQEPVRPQPEPIKEESHETEPAICEHCAQRIERGKQMRRAKQARVQAQVKSTETQTTEMDALVATPVVFVTPSKIKDVAKINGKLTPNSPSSTASKTTADSVSVSPFEPFIKACKQLSSPESPSSLGTQTFGLNDQMQVE